MVRLLVLAIAALTILTGLAQMIWPATMLSLGGARADVGDRHLFATVGLFMVLFGAGVWHTERTAGSRGEILPWATLQKGGASLLVAIGVIRHVFAGRAMLVAAFDGLSAVIFALHWLARRR